MNAGWWIYDHAEVPALQHSRAFQVRELMSLVDRGVQRPHTSSGVSNIQLDRHAFEADPWCQCDKKQVILQLFPPKN